MKNRKRTESRKTPNLRGYYTNKHRFTRRREVKQQTSEESLSGNTVKEEEEKRKIFPRKCAKNCREREYKKENVVFVQVKFLLFSFSPLFSLSLSVEVEFIRLLTATGFSLSRIL